jgi:hypothetical protein
VFLAYAIFVVLLIGLAYVPGYNAAQTGPSNNYGYYGYYGYYAGAPVTTSTTTVTTATTATSTQCQKVAVTFVLPEGGTITADNNAYTNGGSATYCIGQRVHIIAAPPSSYQWGRWDTSLVISVDSNTSDDTYMTVGGPGGLEATFIPAP